jgi:hypothetical protein
MTKPYRVHPKYYRSLATVATVTTVAKVWHRSRTGIHYAIDTENIAAVKCGKTWLISLPSVVAYWGLPPAPIGQENTSKNAVTALQVRSNNGHRSDDDSGAVGSVAGALHGLRDSFFQQEK